VAPPLFSPPPFSYCPQIYEEVESVDIVVSAPSLPHGPPSPSLLGVKVLLKIGSSGSSFFPPLFFLKERECVSMQSPLPTLLFSF